MVPTKRPIYYSKAIFEERGLNCNPLFRDEEDQDCAICLSPLAPATPERKSLLSDAEHEFLSSYLERPDRDPSDIRAFRVAHPCETTPEHAEGSEEMAQFAEGSCRGVRINACGHLLGSVCLSKWLSQANTCPLCRRKLFAKQVVEHRDTLEEMDRIEMARLAMVDWSLVPGGGTSPVLANGGVWW
ncbi:hypothetical protein ACN47E_002092 [Coniothyrium glycines]